MPQQVPKRNTKAENAIDVMIVELIYTPSKPHHFRIGPLGGGGFHNPYNFTILINLTDKRLNLGIPISQ